MALTKNNRLLALDLGERRIGVASADNVAKLASPLAVVANDADVWTEIDKLIKTENADTIIVGLPRSLNGRDTDQTRFVRAFAAELKQKTGLKIVLQDEALTSRQAETELRGRGKKFAKSDIDALAATYILEDYLNSLIV